MWKKIVLSIVAVCAGLYILFAISYHATSTPQFCGSCHEVTKYYTSWSTSVHKNVDCLECHQGSGALAKLESKARGLNYVFQHFSGDYTIPTQAKIFEQSCIKCHLGDDKDYPDAPRLKNTAKVSHYDVIKNSQSCLECHRDTGHAVDIYLTPDLKGAKELS